MQPIIQKSNKLNQVLYDVRGPLVDEAEALERAGRSIIRLNLGNPAPFGFTAPPALLQRMQEILAESQGYSQSYGIESARKAIAAYAAQKGIEGVELEDVYTGNGVSELIQLTLHALVNDGDEILIPSPDYPLWTACVNLAGGKAVHYPCDEQAGWLPDIGELEKRISPRSKAIVVINPNNPTGAVYPKALLEDILQVARRHGLLVFSDEIYDRLIMDGGVHSSLAAMAPDLFHITFSGLSKSHMVCGFRSGWMVLSGNKSLAKDYISGIKMLSSMRLCSNVPGQAIIPAALADNESSKALYAPGGRIYRQRDYIFEALNSIPGVSCVKPQAAFYAFPKLDARFAISSDNRFALDFLRAKGVLVVPGSGFNYPDNNHFRVVYLPPVETLRFTMEALEDFLKDYKQNRC